MKIFRFIFIMLGCLLLSATGKAAQPTMTMEQALDAGNKKAVAYYLKHGDAKTANYTNAKERAYRMANRRSSTGMPYLVLAARQGNAAIVKRLIKAGAKVNVKNSTGFTPLMAAVLNDHLKAAKVLISAKANVNARTPDGTTPLIMASRTDDVRMIKMLINAGADIHARNSKGVHPLEIAISAEKEEALKTLLSAEPEINSPQVQYHFLQAVVTNKTGIVKAFLQKGVSPNAHPHGLPALGAASLQGHVEVVKILLEAGADVNLKTSRGETALALATKKGNKEVAKVLKAAGGKK